MWPMGHLAVAYLLVRGHARIRADGRISDSGVVALAAGSQFPDLIDKPLAWLFSLPSGRTLAHSGLVVGPLVLCCLAWARYRGRNELGAAVALGALSHLVADAVPAVWHSERTLSFLLWPLHSETPYEEPYPGLWRIVVDSAGEPFFLFEMGLVFVAVLVWRMDGYPGPSVPSR